MKEVYNKLFYSNYHLLLINKRFIGRGPQSAMPWPSISPDLKPFEFFPLGQMGNSITLL